MNPSLLYDQLDTVLSVAGLGPTAAEVHGIICGSICNQMKTGVGPDLQRLLGSGADVPAASLAELRDVLEDVLQGTVEELYGDGVEFNLFLPSDNESLPIRLNALGDWCRGFLVGLLNNETFSIDQLSSDSAELARDFISISEVDAQGDTGSDEWDLTEVEEYVRTGVQIIFEEMYAELQRGSVSGEIH